MTSVKEIHTDDPPTAGSAGRGRFRFTDAYSVFDWGEMPDRIPGKGASLCTMGARSLEALEAAGVPTHYEGVVLDGATIPIEDAARPPREMAIELAEVPELPRTEGGYDYDAYHAAAGASRLVPLEVVFRNAVPVGSSLRRRSEPGEHGLAFEDWPDRRVELPDPIVEFSTKLEPADRYLDRETAARIAGPADLGTIEAVAAETNRVVTELADAAGLSHDDGKLECVLVDGTVKVADVVGTLDENRFTYDGQAVSKEVLRQYHRREQPDWVEAVADAKAEATGTGGAGWRERCAREPAPLPEGVVAAVGDLYAASANAYLGRALFDAPGIGTAVDAVRSL